MLDTTTKPKRRASCFLEMPYLPLPNRSAYSKESDGKFGCAGKTGCGDKMVRTGQRPCGDLRRQALEIRPHRARPDRGKHDDRRAGRDVRCQVRRQAIAGSGLPPRSRENRPLLPGNSLPVLIPEAAPSIGNAEDYSITSVGGYLLHYAGSSVM